MITDLFSRRQPGRAARAALAAAALAWFVKTFDLRDAFFFGGLLIAGAGGWRISPPWTLVAIGVVLTLKGNGPLFRARGE